LTSLNFYCNQDIVLEQEFLKRTKDRSAIFQLNNEFGKLFFAMNQVKEAIEGLYKSYFEPFDLNHMFRNRGLFENYIVKLFGEAFRQSDELRFRFVDLDIIETMDLPLVLLETSWKQLEKIKL